MADSLNNDSVEIWKPVPGWEGFYEVRAASQEVRSVDRIVGKGVKRGGARLIKGRIMAPTKMTNGYLAFTFSRDCNRKWYYLHIAVCEAAHGPKPTPKHRVRHLNGDPLDNRPENLCWGTQKENCQDTVEHGRSTRGEKNSQAALTEDDVREIRARCGRGEPQSRVGRDFNVCQGTVSAIICGRSWQWLDAR